MQVLVHSIRYFPLAPELRFKEDMTFVSIYNSDPIMTLLACLFFLYFSILVAGHIGTRTGDKVSNIFRNKEAVFLIVFGYTFTQCMMPHRTDGNHVLYTLKR